MRFVLILVFSFTLFAQQQTRQYYYTYLDRNGRMVINNLPPDHMRGKGFVLMDVKAGPIKLAITKSQMSQVLRSPELIALVDQIADEHSVDTWLVRAVIQVESAFYENARSRKGAMGLMQLIPATAKRFNVIDPFDPVQNITGGVKYLRWLIDFFDSDYKKAIAAYNAGENAVKKHNGIPPFAETIAYVPKVMRLWENKAVVADPGAKGAIDYLKNGRGGFLLNANANLQNASNKTTSQESSRTAEQTVAPRKSVYYWEDANGRVSITDRQPPKDAKNVQVY
ncbi:MAG: transglycosylase SLT domain-containing protein [Holophagales bacterium]|nr:transglycosylase SLT domain-containing protein [Holophagales bacterium]